MQIKSESKAVFLAQSESSSFNKTSFMKSHRSERKTGSFKYTRLESNKTEFKHKVQAIRKKLAGRDSSEVTAELETEGLIESITQVERMAVHYSKYSSVLEVEKALLGLELGRIGRLLTGSNKERRLLQAKFASLEKSTGLEVQRLGRELEEKVV